MKIIFHVGMGKTGTSSVQLALSKSQSVLSESSIEYIGLWLTIINPEYKGYKGFDLFASQDTVAMASDAEKLYKRLSIRQCNTFVYSNESVFSNIYAFVPFIKRLIELGAEVEIVIYVRSMQDWLPSAFTQWNAYHKAHIGPIKSFAEKGRELAATYNNICLWLNEFGDLVKVRKFDKGSNIVVDFSSVLGVNLVGEERRVWERIGAAETVLRAIFNDRLNEQALPHLFEDAMQIDRLEEIRSISKFTEKTLDISALPQIIEETRNISKDIYDRTGIDVIEDFSIEAVSHFDGDIVKDKVTDYMLELLINQSLRIQKLEKLVGEKNLE